MGCPFFFNMHSGQLCEVSFIITAKDMISRQSQSCTSIQFGNLLYATARIIEGLRTMVATGNWK